MRKHQKKTWELGSLCPSFTISHCVWFWWTFALLFSYPYYVLSPLWVWNRLRGGTRSRGCQVNSSWSLFSTPTLLLGSPCNLALLLLFPVSATLCLLTNVHFLLVPVTVLFFTSQVLCEKPLASLPVSFLWLPLKWEVDHILHYVVFYKWGNSWFINIFHLNGHSKGFHPKTRTCNQAEFW